MQTMQTMETKPNKPLYKVTLCWYGENHTFYRHASNEDAAWKLACNALGRRLGVTFGAVMLGTEKSDRKKCVKAVSV